MALSPPRGDSIRRFPAENASLGSITPLPFDRVPESGNHLEGVSTFISWVVPLDHKNHLLFALLILFMHV